MIILLSFVALASLLSSVVGVLYYDQIINYMYDQRRDLWTEVGAPPGILRKPTLPSGIFESSAQTFMFKLAFSTPECMYSDERLKGLVRNYKINGVICTITTILLFFVICAVW